MCAAAGIGLWMVASIVVGLLIGRGIATLRRRGDAGFGP